MPLYNRAVANYEDLPDKGVWDARALMRQASNIWTMLNGPANKLAAWALETRSIPKGKEKALEMAARSVAKGTTNPVKWWQDNRQRILFLLSTLSWPERTEGGDELFTIGKIRVHNTVGLGGADLDAIKDLVETAARLISKTPRFAPILYGDVLVTGQTRGGSSVATYHLSDDHIRIRAKTRFGKAQLRDLVHEFGHRFWHKYMLPEERDVWERYYRQLAIKAEFGWYGKEFPPVGSPTPFPVGAPDVYPTIVSYDSGRVNLSGGGYISRETLGKAMSTLDYFPTEYAATNPSEFFAESFSFYVVGGLSDGITKKFQTVTRV